VAARYTDLTKRTAGGAIQFNSMVRPIYHEIDRPKRTTAPTVFFVCSRSDLYHPDSYRRGLTEAVKLAEAEAPQHLYLELTKRPDLMWTDAWGNVPDSWSQRDGPPSAPGNVWSGVSVWNQTSVDSFLWRLIDTPAALRFVSAEPLLDSLDLSPYLPRLGWVIVGGESGPRALARPCSIGWISDIVDQCRKAGVPVFVKQLGTNPTQGGRVLDLKHPRGADPDEWPAVVRNLPARRIPPVQQ